MTPATTLEFEGESKLITEWALDYGILPEIIIARLRYGETIRMAITKPMEIVARGQRLPIFHPNQGRIVKQRDPSREETRGRPSRDLTFNGHTHSVVEWANKLGISSRTLNQRLRKGWTLDDALGSSKRSVAQRGRLISYNGEARTARGWAEHTGLPMKLICKRLRLNWSVERALGFAPRPGVSSNFAPAEGTGAGAALQDGPNISFPEEAKS